MKELITGFTYRPEIDALRALAVTSVLLCHFDLGVPGGFVGVDVFFVVSGYLITSLILNDIQAGKFTLANFWERRARRIIPAAVATVAVTGLAGWFLLLPVAFDSLGKSMVSHAFFVANIYFWRSDNYFAAAAGELPLLHTWSLAVEEQFYIFFPLALLVLFASPLTRTRKPLFLVLCAASLASLVLSVMALPRYGSATFYLLPTRAWELLLGSIVSIIPAAITPQKRHVRELFCGVGLIGIIAPCFLYSNSISFPGIAALPPCVGTALFIIGTTHHSGMPLPNITRPLILRPVIFIGLISYSLYLVHWPIIAFANYLSLEELPLNSRLIGLALSVILGVLSWRFVETPFRKRKLCKSRASIFRFAGTGLAATLIAGIAFHLCDGLPSRFTDRVIALEELRSQNTWDNPIVRQSTVENAKNGVIPFLGAEDSPRKVLVWGDSHARSISPGLLKAASKENMSIAVAWASATPPICDFTPDNKFSLGSDAPEWAESIVNYVGENRIPSVLLAAQWSAYFRCNTEFSTQLISTIKKIQITGASVWILNEVPNHSVDVLKALSHQEIFGTDPTKYACTAESLIQQNSELNQLKPELEELDIQVIDIASFFVDSATGRYKMEIDGVPLYVDGHHLTIEGAQLAAEAFLPLCFPIPPSL